MPSQRKRKLLVCSQVLRQFKKRGEVEAMLWDLMPAVGREFGSPEFERLHADAEQPGGKPLSSRSLATNL